MYLNFVYFFDALEAIPSPQFTCSTVSFNFKIASYRGAGNFRPEISSAARCRFENREEKRKALYRGARRVKEFLDLRERASSRRADDFGPKNTRDL